MGYKLRHRPILELETGPQSIIGYYSFTRGG